MFNIPWISTFTSNCNINPQRDTCAILKQRLFLALFLHSMSAGKPYLKQKHTKAHTHKYKQHWNEKKSWCFVMDSRTKLTPASRSIRPIEKDLVQSAGPTVSCDFRHRTADTEPGQEDRTGAWMVKPFFSFSSSCDFSNPFLFCCVQLISEVVSYWCLENVIEETNKIKNIIEIFYPFYERRGEQDGNKGYI